VTDMVAMVVLLLLHTPLPDGSVSVVAEPVHIARPPVMPAGAELIVTIVVVLHPAGSV